MKKYMKHFILLLTICLCAMLFAACGNSGIEGMAKDISKIANETQGFYLSCNYDTFGTIGSTDVKLYGYYTREQSETSGNIYDSIDNYAKIGDIRGQEYLKMYRIDGNYYYEDDAVYTCDAPIVDELVVPGKNFWPIFIAAEKTQVDEDNLSCTVVLSGNDLKETVKELSYQIYTQVEHTADWSQMQGEVSVDFMDGGDIEMINISCPALGELLIQTIDDSATANCTDFSMEIDVVYYDPEVRTPDGMNSATSAPPVMEYGVTALIDFLVGEQEEVESFVPVELNGEGSITLSAKGKTVVLAFPSDIGFYDRITQNEPWLAILGHDLFGDVTGRTIVQLQQGTAADFFNSLNRNIASAEDVVVNGIQGKLIAEKREEENYFGKHVCLEDYYFAAEMDGVVLGFRIEAVYDKEDAGIIDESIVADLLSYCTIG